MGFNGRVALLMLSLAILIQPIFILYVIFAKDDDPDTHKTKVLKGFKQQKIPVFYNLFVANASESSRVMDIVSEQRALLRPVHQPFFIQSMGTVELKISNTTVLGHRTNGTEMVTLHSLWDFCTREKGVDKVVYLHSKGSSRNTLANENLRKFLTIGALSEECALVDSSTCNVCSSRFSPLPHPHTSGNMWLASCDYVRKLIDPFDFEERMHEFTSNCTAKGRESCDGRLRFSAEHWIHSHPSVKPCDLHKDPEFVWDYDGVPSNGKFEIELAQAPRFDLIKYVKWGKCVGRGVKIDHRLDEYWRLYNETPGKSWWGWNFLQTDKNWIPKDLKAARMWRKKELCWRGVVKNDTESTPKESVEQSTKQSRAEKKEYVLKNNTRVCPSGSRAKQGLSIDEMKNGTSISLYESTDTPKAIKATKKRVLVIAAVPVNKRHILALWTQLECLTIRIDHVVLATPLWSKEISSQIIALAKDRIPRFNSGEVSIQPEYFLNNRYDVGLWCDAISSLKPDGFDEFGLVNDSVFVMRSSSEVFDALSLKNVSLASSGYSYTPKFFEGNDDHIHFWVESIYRGFTKTGIDIFREYSCVPEDHPFFCPDMDDNKACIVNNFEHDLAIQYPCDKVYGVYPSDAPASFLEKNRHRMWARNNVYWKAMKAELKFPFAKVNQMDQVRSLGPRLKECTKYYDDMVEKIDLSLAKPRHRRKWVKLDLELQERAHKIFGFDNASWENWASSKFAQIPFDELTKEQQSFLTSSLDCSPKSWNNDRCGPD